MNNVLEGMIWFFMVSRKDPSATKEIISRLIAICCVLCTLTSEIARRSRHL